MSLRARARLTESMGGKLLNEVSSMVGVARVVLFSFCVHIKLATGSRTGTETDEHRSASARTPRSVLAVSSQQSAVAYSRK